MKRVAMIFEKSELVFDIKNRAYITAKSASQKSETPDTDDSWLIDIANKEELTRETAGRFMTLAFMDAYAKCSPLAPEADMGDYVENDKYVEVDRYVMKLLVRDDAKMHLVRALQDLIHEYIVYKTLLQWCEMASREHVEVFATRVATLEGQIKTAIKPIQGNVGERPLFPFG